MTGRSSQEAKTPGAASMFCHKMAGVWQLGGKTSTTWTKDNPSPGRPPAEKSLTKALRDKADPETMAKRLLELAHDKDKAIALRATTYLFDRLDGTPLQSLRTQSEDLPQIVIAGPGGLE